MLQVSHVSKSYGVETVLDDVSFVVNRSERIGLVGANGSGKTTLLRIIAGLEQPDQGTVSFEPRATPARQKPAKTPGQALGYLPQGLEDTFGETVGAAIRSGIRGLEEARTRVDTLAARMAAEHGVSSPQLLEEYGDALARFEELGGYEIDAHVEFVMAGLDLDAVDPATSLEQLSGGQRTRVGLARLLLSGPSLLLLDEPTNHLDITALEWLERFLKSYRGAAMIVSHDRTFLDRTVTRILELDERTHHIIEYAGNYSDYEEVKRREIEKQLSAWKDQTEEIARLQDSARHLRGVAKFRRGGKADTNDKFAKGFFANRGAGTIARAKRIEQRLERLVTDERIDKPQQAWRMKLEFGEMPRGGEIVVQLDDVGLTFGEQGLFRHANLLLRHGERVALLGPNGAGKTTLLRIIASELMPTQGHVQIGSNVRVGYMPQEQETLEPTATPLSLIRELAPLNETDARHLLHFFLFEGDDVFVPIGQLSYGERARLLLAKLVVARANCLLLDEPINHLDIPSRERFEAALDAFPGTILVATHDRAFIDRFATGVWAIEDKTVKRFPDRRSSIHH